MQFAADQHGHEVNFDQILDDAIALLEQPARDMAAATEVDELQERLLAGHRCILVDEYQDIDAKQYALVRGLAGRRLADPDAKLTILAVGDDDQNIYAFRATSIEFIRRFEQDYQAGIEYLIENYRSSQHIIDVANAVIADNGGRLKANHPIRINHARAVPCVHRRKRRRRQGSDGCPRDGGLGFFRELVTARGVEVGER